MRGAIRVVLLAVYVAGGLLVALVGLVFGVLTCGESCDQDGGGWNDDPASPVWDLLTVSALLAAAAVAGAALLAALGQGRWARLAWGAGAAACAVVAVLAGLADDGNPAVALIAAPALAAGYFALVRQVFIE